VVVGEAVQKFHATSMPIFREKASRQSTQRGELLRQKKVHVEGRAAKKKTQRMTF